MDKKQDLCISQTNTTNQFTNCKLSIDSITCEECSNNYYFDEDKNHCISINYCSESDSNYTCTKCIENYYFTISNNVCTNSQNCLYGDKDLGICTICASGNYLDKNDGICKSNQELNIFKNCEVALSNKCVKCINGFFLSDDKKCTNANNCSLANNNSTCIACRDNYYLGLDNLCSSIEHCIYTDTIFNNGGCAECEDGYYYLMHPEKSECVLSNDNLKNCQATYDTNGEYCISCKNGYYLSVEDGKCYDNSRPGIFYKCAYSNDNNTACEFSEEGYYLGEKDRFCNSVDWCLVSDESRERCLECDDFYCLNLKDGKCYDNYPPEMPNENELIYYNCNKTNEEGTECAECASDDFILKNGYCYNIENCEEMDGDECLKCKTEGIDWNGSSCINKDFGCVTSKVFNCLKCDNNTNFDSCDQCIDGYELEGDYYCKKIGEKNENESSF